MVTNFRRKIAEIGDTPSLLGLAFHNGWQDGKVDALTEHNFGPLTPEFTVMGEIVETRSILETRIRQRMAATAERICAKFTRKTCLVLRSDEFECQGQRSKVKVTRTKKPTVHSKHPSGVDGMERPRCR